jgi:hypothetical protein
MPRKEGRKKGMSRKEGVPRNEGLHLLPRCVLEAPSPKNHLILATLAAAPGGIEEVLKDHTNDKKSCG